MWTWCPSCSWLGFFGSEYKYGLRENVKIYQSNIKPILLLFCIYLLFDDFVNLPTFLFMSSH